MTDLKDRCAIIAFLDAGRKKEKVVGLTLIRLLLGFQKLKPFFKAVKDHPSHCQQKVTEQHK